MAMHYYPVPRASVQIAGPLCRVPFRHVPPRLQDPRKIVTLLLLSAGVSVVDCAGTPSTAAPFMAQPQTAAASCDAAATIFTDPEAEAVIGRFELTCGSSSGQEQVSMVLASPKSDGTRILWFYGSISDGNSSELITIECVDAAADTDQDGCTDLAEARLNQYLGGQRDYNYFWDFYDVWTHPLGEPTVWERDGVVNLAGDIVAVAIRFGANDAGPGTFDRTSDPLSTPNALTGDNRSDYHPSYDRSPVMGPNP